MKIITKIANHYNFRFGHVVITQEQFMNQLGRKTLESLKGIELFFQLVLELVMQQERILAMPALKLIQKGLLTKTIKV